ncbi:MAG: FliI/YscN family ATPase [Candidatus Hydrogenedentes bacterium]|nr:FliI/YscN family ATPase [Candidatus Hydrogenedentota bacterium]
MTRLDLQTMLARIDATKAVPVYGKVTDLTGLAIEATGPDLAVGHLCYIETYDGADQIPAEVVGFRGDRILLMPLGEMRGIGPGSLMIPTHQPLKVHAGPHLIGRILGGLGQPIDGGPSLDGGEEINVHALPPRPMERTRILDPIATGVRAIDACITCGKGQRIGIMSGSGVGKSKLLGMIARNTDADINVIALIGERGREVRDFIEVDLGDDGLTRSVVVVATSDEPALVRIKAAHLATAIAEWFRAQGNDVMLMMDSATRFAMAQREVGLALGEPPTTKGYPPSAFAALPKLFERAGTSPEGSITGFYTVLVESDDMNDPVGDSIRSILDGHIVLSRDLASRGHYPAVDVLESISRVMVDVTSKTHQELAQRVRQILATYRDAEDLVNIGAYVSGTNAEIDMALRLVPKINSLLRQGLFDTAPFEEIEDAMRQALA